jgi:NlpC/P60 family putative phage cell wall peptidase
MTRAGLAVQEARRWIGTPYVHQASLCRHGTDCLGLLRGIWRALYGTEPDVVPPYTEDWAEPARQEVLMEAALRWLVPKTNAAASAGDVLLFRMREGSVAKHLGVQSEIGAHPRFIHSYTGHGVIESSFSQPWQRRMAARFAFPEGDI